MGDLFSQYAPVNPEYKSEKLDTLVAYEEHYMRLLYNYKAEISEIEKMMEQLRLERTEFYTSKLPEIEKTIMEDEVLSEEAKTKWIMELRANVEKSFAISESLILHYVTSNLEEFKCKMQSIIDKV